MYKYLICTLLFILSQPCSAETKIYQTALKSAVTDQQQIISSPLISVNPNSGETHVFITPNSHRSSQPGSHNKTVHHAQALYEATSTGITQSITKLHHHMAKACPQGWIKRYEWVTLKTDTPELHYQFQCLNTTLQD
jgi:hypothetical protein